jgi:hypothetical protein
MQNPILTALKLIVFTTFTIFLGLTFFQNLSSENEALRESSTKKTWKKWLHQIDN